MRIQLKAVTCVLAAVVSLGCIHAAGAAEVAFVREINDSGATGPMVFGTDGYDLYATSLPGEPPSSGGVPFGPTRLTSLPSYITSITSAGANSYFRSNYAQIINPFSNTLVRAGLTYNFSASNMEKGLLHVNIGAGAPPTFYIGYVTDQTGEGGVFDYPDALRFRQTAGGGSGNSGLITTLQDGNGGIDLYLFRVTGSMPGDVITISGVETTGGPGYYNLTAAGLIFAVPEPSVVILLSFAALCTMWRSRGIRT